MAQRWDYQPLVNFGIRSSLSISASNLPQSPETRPTLDRPVRGAQLPHPRRVPLLAPGSGQHHDLTVTALGQLDRLLGTVGEHYETELRGRQASHSRARSASSGSKRCGSNGPPAQSRRSLCSGCDGSASTAWNSS